jgi:hypothetical protein
VREAAAAFMHSNLLAVVHALHAQQQLVGFFQTVDLRGGAS